MKRNVAAQLLWATTTTSATGLLLLRLYLSLRPCFLIRKKEKEECLSTWRRKGKIQQSWAHSKKRKSVEVQQPNKLVNFFSSDDLTVFLCFLGSACVKAAYKHVDEIDPSRKGKFQRKIGLEELEAFFSVASAKEKLSGLMFSRDKWLKVLGGDRFLLRTSSLSS